MTAKLLRGVRAFQSKSFPKREMLFKRLSSEQDPETLFITCIDSRVNPHLITQAQPGDFFVVRNMGNIIPPYSSSASFSSSVAAELEFTLTQHKIKDIIICGHSECGAMKGLLSEDTRKKLPHVGAWLSHSNNVLKTLHEGHADSRIKLSIATKNNILLQIEHLKTYPLVAEKLARNELKIHGWVYDISSGKVFVHQQQSNEFISLDQSLGLSIELPHLQRLVGQANDSYQAHSMKLRTKLSIFHRHGAAGRKRAAEFTEMFRKITDPNEAFSTLHAYLSDRSNGNRHPHSFKTMLLAAIINDQRLSGEKLDSSVISAGYEKNYLKKFESMNLFEINKPNEIGLHV